MIIDVLKSGDVARSTRFILRFHSCGTVKGKTKNDDESMELEGRQFDDHVLPYFRGSTHNMSTTCVCVERPIIIGRIIIIVYILRDLTRLPYFAQSTRRRNFHLSPPQKKKKK